MKVHLSEGTLRVGLIVFSLIYGILSVSLICLGIAYSEELKWPRSYADWRLLDMPSFIITMGAMSLVISIVGCYCAKTYRRKIFLLFVVGLCSLLILEMFVAVVTLSYDPVERKRRTLRLMQESVELKGTDIYFNQLEDHVSID